MQRRPKAPSRAGGEALSERQISSAGFTEAIRAWKGQSTVIDQVSILLKPADADQATSSSRGK